MLEEEPFFGLGNIVPNLFASYTLAAVLFSY